MKEIDKILQIANDYGLIQRLRNFLSSGVFVALAYLFYRKNSFYREFLNKKYQIPEFKLIIESSAIFKYGAILYFISLFLIYFLARKTEAGKGIYAIQGLSKIFFSPIKTFEDGLLKKEKISILAIIVKIFFTPLMISWLLSAFSEIIMHGMSVIRNKEMLLSNFSQLFSQHLFWMLFNLILFIDVIFFATGYLLELSSLKNNIISVEPTLLGWAVALICYPPFNSLAGKVIMWKSSDSPYFQNGYLFLSINILILGFMGVYSWASVALGFKASNLTHRGIVAKGPYSLIRHPAYICKNIAWWLGGIPFIIFSAKTGVMELILVLFSLCSWSAIYFMRAMTEERHLRSVNPEYDEYIKKVPYRFVPWVV